MSRFIFSSILAACTLLFGCSSSDTDEPAAPKTTCSLSDVNLVCKCAASPGDGGTVPSCSETMFTVPGLCCADDEKNECTCLGYACVNSKCTWGVPFGNLIATGMYCCANSSTFGGQYGECECTQYEPCSDHETQVEECSPETMPKTCPQNQRKVETCQPQ